MKNILLLLLLSLFTFTVNAQEEKNKELPDISEAERIIDKYSDKIYGFAESTAKTLEQPAKQVYESIVKLQIAKGIVFLICSLFALGLVVLNIVYFSEWADDSEGASIILLMVSLIGFVILLYHGMVRIIAPDIYAIQYIIETLK